MCDQSARAFRGAAPPDRRCPDCGAPALRVLWGMPMRDPGPDVILGGCVAVAEPTPWRCRVCDWAGELATVGSARP